MIDAPQRPDGWYTVETKTGRSVRLYLTALDGPEQIACRASLKYLKKLRGAVEKATDRLVCDDADADNDQGVWSDGESADSRGGPPQVQIPSWAVACHSCRGRLFWRSVDGVAICATCHPPAATELIATWIGREQ